jgi:hypothetical protein
MRDQKEVSPLNAFKFILDQLKQHEDRLKVLEDMHLEEAR